MSNIFGAPKFGQTPTFGSGNAFGNNTSAGGGSGTFGNTSGTNNAFSSTSTAPNTFGHTGTGTSAFGNTNTEASAFGNTGAGTNTFGNTNAGANPFGNSGATTNTFGANGTSGFGNTGGGTNAFGTGGGTGGPNIFGNSSNATSAFGNPTVGTNAYGTTGNGFGPHPFFAATNNYSNPLAGGAMNTNTTPNPLFGNNTFNQTPSSTGTGSIFGNTTTNNNASPFGQPQQQQQHGSIFGSTPSIFSQPQNQNQSNNPLGSTTAPNIFSSAQTTAPNTNQNPFSASSLGSGTNPLFGPKPAGSTMPNNSSTAILNSASIQQGLDLQQRIEAIVAAWNPSSPQCRFQHYFYNLVDPNQVQLYGRPSNATNDALWHQAVRENPDPSCMVPVLAVGFDDLQKRVDAQSVTAKQHHEKLKELQTRLHTLSQTHVLQTTLRITRALQAHTVITHRLLRLIEHLHLLIPSLRSSSISPEEESLRARLERLKDELAAGGGRGRLNELWAVVGAVKAARESAGIGKSDGVEWKVVDWEGLERLAEVLNEQQQGLAHLTSVINNGLKDLQIMEGTEERPRESFAASGLGSSTFGNSAMLGSTLR